jgi:hypothetical protein
MSHEQFSSAQDAQNAVGLGDKSRNTRVAETEIPDSQHAVQTKPEGATESRREEADRQAIERGEDDGMIVHQSATTSAHSTRDLNATAEG